MYILARSAAGKTIRPCLQCSCILAIVIGMEIGNTMVAEGLHFKLSGKVLLCIKHLHATIEVQHMHR